MGEVHGNEFNMTLQRHWPKLVTAMSSATVLRQFLQTFAPVLPSWASWVLSWVTLVILLALVVLALACWVLWRLFAGAVRRAFGRRQGKA